MLLRRLITALMGACFAVAMTGSLIGSVDAEAATANTKRVTNKSKAKASPRISQAVSLRKSSQRSAPRRHSKAASASRSKAAARKVVFQRPARPDFDKEGNPLLRSSAFIVQDMDSGAVLLEKNSEQALPIASITKLMTAMVVLDADLDLSEMLAVSDDDVDRIKGSSSHVPVGALLSREDMLHLALMASENRAASALARHYPGGQVAFIAAMNAKARSLGLSDTRFFDSVGLNSKNVASARDLVEMTTVASRYPLISAFSTTAEHSVFIKGRERAFRNTNALVRNSDWQINLSKTGYISESGKCLVMQAVLGNKRMAIILLDSSGRFTRVADAVRIRKWVESAMMAARLSARSAAQTSALSSLN